MILFIDNYDSFSYNLVDLLKQHYSNVVIRRNDECTLEELILLNPQAIVISPGPGRPEQAGFLMEIINAFVGKIPMLGICLGQQAIAQHFGASVKHAKKGMHGKVSKINFIPHPMFNNVPQGAEMMRYHSLIVENLPESFYELAHTDEMELMAIAHKKLPVWTLQFHPESVLSINGPQIIVNWLSHFQLIKL